MMNHKIIYLKFTLFLSRNRMTIYIRRYCGQYELNKTELAELLHTITCLFCYYDSPHEIVDL